MLDPNFKAKWVNALRSGEYKQANAYLRRQRLSGDFGFCCLGVLCDVSGAQWNGDGEHGTLDSFDVKRVDEAFLSDWMLKRVGLSDEEQKELAKRNDKGESFEMIADYIEANL